MTRRGGRRPAVIAQIAALDPDGTHVAADPDSGQVGWRVTVPWAHAAAACCLLEAAGAVLASPRQWGVDATLPSGAAVHLGTDVPVEQVALVLADVVLDLPGGLRRTPLEDDSRLAVFGTLVASILHARDRLPFGEPYLPQHPSAATLAVLICDHAGTRPTDLHAYDTELTLVDALLDHPWIVSTARALDAPMRMPRTLRVSASVTIVV